MRARSLAWALVGIAACSGLGPLAAASARAQTGGPGAPGATPLEDLLQIVVLERELLAVDAESGGDTRESLELGERVLWQGARGRVGVVLTDRRVLAVGTGSAAWQDARYRRRERPPSRAHLGDRVALVLLATRALGFNGGSGNLVERSLGPGEAILELGVSGNVAVVVTDRRALGLSPFAGGFFEAKLQLRERVEAVRATGNLATVTTSRRLLTFRAPSGSWGERNLDLR